MNGGREDYQHQAVTDAIICCFYTVYNTLGHGFLEKDYENALLAEFGKRNIVATAQCPIVVYYGETRVGEYFADILVENAVIVEVKTARDVAPEHEAQLLNYLKATDIEVGLLLNFGVQPQVRRRSFANERKGNWPRNR